MFTVITVILLASAHVLLEVYTFVLIILGLFHSIPPIMRTTYRGGRRSSIADLREAIVCSIAHTAGSFDTKIPPLEHFRYRLC